MSKLQELIQQYCPDGVEYKMIGEICDLSAGGDVPKNNFSDEKNNEFSIPIISNGIGKNAIYGYTNISKINTTAVTISARGTIGYCELRNYPFYPVVRLICAVPHKELLAGFLKYYLETISFQVPKTGIPQLTVPMVSKYVIPVPPLEVQAEIVRILDTFTELQTKLEEELTARQKQYEYYRDSLLNFNHKIEGVQWFELGKSCEMKAGKAILASELNETMDSNHKFKCYGGNGIRGYIDKYNYQGEYPIIGRQGALCGNVQYANGTFYATEHAVVVKSKGFYNQRFLYYLLTYMDLNRYKSSGAQPGLAVSKLETISAPVPPLDVQQRIVEVLDNFEKICTDLKIGLPAEINARKQQYEYYRDKLLTFRKKDEL